MASSSSSSSSSSVVVVGALIVFIVTVRFFIRFLILLVLLLLRFGIFRFVRGPLQPPQMLLGRFLHPVDVVDAAAARPLLLDVLHHLGRAAVALAAGREEPRSPLLAGEHDGGGPTAGEREAGLVEHAPRELLDRGDLLVGRVGWVILGRDRGFPVRGWGRGVVRGVASASSAEDPAIGFPRG